MSLELTDGERRSPIWQKIERALLARLDRHRKQNDQLKSEQDTNILRGQIKELKFLLSAEKDSPPT